MRPRDLDAQLARVYDERAPGDLTCGLAAAAVEAAPPEPAPR